MRWLFAFLLMTGVATAQLPQPSIIDWEYGTPRKNYPDRAESRSADERGTVKSPFITRAIKSNEEIAEEKAERADKSFNDNITIFLSFFVALAGLLQVRALLVQIRTTRVQLRAYVSAFPKHIFSFNGEDGFCRIDYQLKNVGLTPAHSITHHSEIIAVPFPIPVDFEPASINTRFSNPIVLFPNVDMIGWQIASRTFNADELAAIIRGDMRICIYGEVFYDDIFGQRGHRTRFAATVRGDQDALSALASNYPLQDLDIRFETAEIWNDAS